MEDKNEKFTIQEVADLVDLSVHTLRYYERIGLMAPIDRASSGHRRYTNGDLGWLRLLNRLRYTGMSIRQMQDFAELSRQGDDSVPQRLALLEQHERQVQQHIQDLESNLAAIHEKVNFYRLLKEAREAQQISEEALPEPELLREPAEALS